MEWTDQGGGGCRKQVVPIVFGNQSSFFKLSFLNSGGMAVSFLLFTTAVTIQDMHCMSTGFVSVIVQLHTKRNR